jgi:chromosome segregation ATPase
MQTLPQPADNFGEARPVSEILSRADPADMPAMRAGLSFLTSAGAELATALEKSNQENQRLMAIVSALPPEWVQAATTGRTFPDFGALRAELELLKDERIDLRGQLVERDQLIQALNEQVAQIQAEQQALLAVEEPEAEAAAARLEALQAEMDSISLARAQADDSLRASEAELADIEQQLAGLNADILATLPEDVLAQLTAAPADDQAPDSRQRRAMQLGALAAAASALVERSQQNDALAQEANSRAGAIQGELEAASATRVALEADLVEKQQSLEDLNSQIESLQAEFEGLNAQIEQLKEQAADLQDELDVALAAKAAAEEQLVAREGELAELHQQIDSVAQQLRTVLPEDMVAQLAPAESEEPVAASTEELAPEGEAALEGDMATRSAAPKMLGLGALAAGVAAAVDLSKQKAGEAEEASGQLATTLDEKTGLESALDEKEQAIAELNAQIEALNGQTADIQAQLAAALAITAGLEQQAGERDSLLSDLQGQVDDAVNRLQAIVPVEDLPQPEVPEAVEGEAGEGTDDAGEGAAGVVKAAGLTSLVTGVAALVERNNSSLAELQAQLDGLSQEKTALEAALEEKAGELAGYNDYALNLQGQVNEFAAQVSSVEAALALKEQAEAEAQAQIETLTAQIEALNAQVADLQTQLDAASSAQAELEQTLHATQAQLETVQADLAQIDEEAQRSLGDKAVRLGAVGAGAAAVAAIRDKDEALAAANEQVLALQQQIAGLSADSAEAATLQAQLAELTAAKAELDAQLGERSAEMETLAAQLAELEGERDAIALSKEELAASLEGREAELADLRSQLEALQGQVEERGAVQEQPAQAAESFGEAEALRSAALSFEAASMLSETLARLPKIKTSAASAAIVAGVQPVLSPRIQALTDVKGIGSVYQQRLYKAGVGTYWELASLPDADMQDTLQIPELQRPRIDFEETRADAYQWAQLTDTVGLLWDGDHVDDFEMLPGIGKTFEKRLYEAGITTYEQLMDADVERLVEIIQAPPMRDVNYDELKERAQQVLAERLAGQPDAQEQPAE